MSINETVAGTNSVVINGAASGEKRRGAIRTAKTYGRINLFDLPALLSSSRCFTGRFYLFLALVIGLCTMSAQAEEYRYRLVTDWRRRVDHVSYTQAVKVQSLCVSVRRLSFVRLFHLLWCWRPFIGSLLNIFKLCCR